MEEVEEVLAPLQINCGVFHRIEGSVVVTIVDASSLTVVLGMEGDAKLVVDQVAASEAEELPESEAAGCALYHAEGEMGYLGSPFEVVWVSKVPPPFSHDKLQVTWPQYLVE